MLKKSLLAACMATGMIATTANAGEIVIENSSDYFGLYFKYRPFNINAVKPGKTGVYGLFSYGGNTKKIDHRTVDTIATGAGAGYNYAEAAPNLNLYGEIGYSVVGRSIKGYSTKVERGMSYKLGVSYSLKETVKRPISIGFNSLKLPDYYNGGDRLNNITVSLYY